MRHTGDSGGVTSRNYKSVIGETDCLTDYRGFSNLFMDIGHTTLFESQFGEGPWEVGLKLPLENDVMMIHEAGACVIHGDHIYYMTRWSLHRAWYQTAQNGTGIILENGVD